MKQGGIMGFGISRSKQRAFIRHLLFTRLELMHLIPPSKGPHDAGAVLVDFTLVTFYFPFNSPPLSSLPFPSLNGLCVWSRRRNSV